MTGPSPTCLLCREPALLHVPPELLALCFGLLTLGDLLSVSRASRHWRAIALGTPALWATFKVGTGRRQTRRLAEMLRCSQAAPLSVQLTLTPAEEALLCPHFARLRELVCDDVLGPIQTPIVRKLELGRKYDRSPFLLSAEFVGAAAGSLETMRLNGFVLAPSCPLFLSLRALRAIFTQPQTTCLPDLLALCPALESLAVCCVSDTELGVDPRALFVPLPASLRDVSIFGVSSSVSYIECATLQPWTGHAFRSFKLPGSQTSRAS